MDYEKESEYIVCMDDWWFGVVGLGECIVNYRNVCKGSRGRDERWRRRNE